MLTQAFALLDRFRRDQTGAVAVEFVLLAPLVFALLFGIIIVGYYIGVSHSVSQLATGAARASVVGLDTQERETLALGYLEGASVNYPMLKQDALTSEAVLEEGTPPGVTVTVTYEVDGSILGVANSLLGLSLKDIKGSAYLAY
ncbi:pilus assembly protein [Sulfitobacter sp. M57]|uniref:TadE/TadG family type IV pilus assembly protein n=1 Tax=unclassified Sulfitobacter TaxID=196795 RepID=UPI0023E1C95E|nr:MULTISPECIES: TadE/TadG family type IV pilus assembly protein [unclassified Sulfitobacter]MDF3413762.1 pilus assembly protein [Sulfitobacter sp. KE5]MDF3420957.1 pilus assembly protein [Sulfitobacter sp. KE43]MDF3432308.1 pilus assembly protein [Sulfitobacter sp. KE42]MDF3457947.1 pilus assembly protein [Sulfitobacter sp. S74]MDF3461848.1 pilus assembly protein [Sulfitobacter sp. Ks18]